MASSVFNGTGLVWLFTILGLLLRPFGEILAPGFEQEDLLLATRLTESCSLPFFLWGWA